VSSLLLITHGGIGEAMLAMVVETLGECSLPVRCLGVATSDDPADVLTRARGLVAELGGDVIVLTDLFGSTPSNIAARLVQDRKGLIMIAGLNLPMLIRLFNYAGQDLLVLAEKAVKGGRDGIFIHELECYL